MPQRKTSNSKATQSSHSIAVPPASSSGLHPTFPDDPFVSDPFFQLFDHQATDTIFAIDPTLMQHTNFSGHLPFVDQLYGQPPDVQYNPFDMAFTYGQPAIGDVPTGDMPSAIHQQLPHQRSLPQINVECSPSSPALRRSKEKPLRPKSLYDPTESGSVSPTGSDDHCYRGGGEIPSPILNPEAEADADPTLPGPYAYAKIEREYLLNISPRKRDKALLSQHTYDAVLAILQHPGKSSSETAQFRFWSKKMFHLAEYNGEGVLCHDSKPVATREQIFEVLCHSHFKSGHGGRDKTSAEVRRFYSWVPKEIIARFVRDCPFCRSRRTQSVTSFDGMSESQAFFMSLQNDGEPVKSATGKISLAAAKVEARRLGYQPYRKPLIPAVRRSSTNHLRTSSSFQGGVKNDNAHRSHPSSVLAANSTAPPPMQTMTLQQQVQMDLQQQSQLELQQEAHLASLQYQQALLSMPQQTQYQEHFLPVPAPDNTTRQPSSGFPQPYPGHHLSAPPFPKRSNSYAGPTTMPTYEGMQRRGSDSGIPYDYSHPHSYMDPPQPQSYTQLPHSQSGLPHNSSGLPQSYTEQPTEQQMAPVSSSMAQMYLSGSGDSMMYSFDHSADLEIPPMSSSMAQLYLSGSGDSMAQPYDFSDQHNMPPISGSIAPHCWSASGHTMIPSFTGSFDGFGDQRDPPIPTSIEEQYLSIPDDVLEQLSNHSNEQYLDIPDDVLEQLSNHSNGYLNFPDDVLEESSNHSIEQYLSVPDDVLEQLSNHSGEYLSIPEDSLNSPSNPSNEQCLSIPDKAPEQSATRSTEAYLSVSDESLRISNQSMSDFEWLNDGVFEDHIPL